MTLRVLSISTLFPNTAKPAFGLFVARQAEALSRCLSVDKPEEKLVDMVVISPQPSAPPPFNRYFHTDIRSLPMSAKDWGVQVHYPRYAYLPRIGPRWNPWLIAKAALPLARRLHAEQPFDLVDAQFFYPDGPAAAHIAKELGLPLSIKSRGSDIIMWGTKGFARNQMLIAANQAAGLLAVSGALKADMVALGMPEDKITVHYTGLDHSKFLPIPKTDARQSVAGIVPQGGDLLVTVGYLVPVKGQDLVIRALPLLPDVRYVLAGTGPEETNLRALASQLDVADRVHFAGSLKPDILAPLLCAADAMVLTSEREGLANAWVEALACGTPIVISDVGGAREVVRDTSAGRIVDRHPDAISLAVRSLLNNPPSQEDVAQNVARFSWDENAKQLANYYASIVGN